MQRENMDKEPIKIEVNGTTYEINDPNLDVEEVRRAASKHQKLLKRYVRTAFLIAFIPALIIAQFNLVHLMILTIMHFIPCMLIAMFIALLHFTRIFPANIREVIAPYKRPTRSTDFNTSSDASSTSWNNDPAYSSTPGNIYYNPHNLTRD